MYQVTGWNLEPKVCKLCGHLSNHTDIVINLEDKNKSEYFSACRDCTNGKIISDSILNVWNNNKINNC